MRVLRAGTALLVLAAGSVSVLPCRAHIPFGSAQAAQPVSAAQQDKVREALIFSGGAFEFNFNFSARHGMTLYFGFAGRQPHPEKDALEAFQARPVPSDTPKRAAYELQLAKLANAAKQEPVETAALKEAITLYRKLLASYPTQKAAWLIGLGTAQNQGGDLEAEQTWREAVRLDGQNWKTWTGLGEALSTKASKIAFDGLDGSALFSQMTSDPAAAYELLRQKSRSPEQIARSRPIQAEARRCFDKAVALAPREVGTYQARSMAYTGSMIYAMMDAGANAAKNASGDASRQAATTLLGAFAHPDFIANLNEIARLTPNDPDALSGAALLQVFPTLSGDGTAGFTAVTQRLDGPLARIATSPQATRQQRTRATEMRVTLFVAQKNYDQAERIAREALNTDASNQQLQDMLLITFMVGEKNQLARAILNTYLPQRDAPYWRMMLAKTYLRDKQLPETEKALRDARAKYPGSDRIRLALAVTRLKSADDVEARQEASALLDSLNTTSGTSDLSDDDKITVSLARVALAALQGDGTRATSLLSEVEKLHKEDDDVQAMRTALNAAL